MSRRQRTLTYCYKNFVFTYQIMFVRLCVLSQDLIFCNVNFSIAQASTAFECSFKPNQGSITCFNRICFTNCASHAQQIAEAYSLIKWSAVKRLPVTTLLNKKITANCELSIQKKHVKSKYRACNETSNCPICQA